MNHLHSVPPPQAPQPPATPEASLPVHDLAAEVQVLGSMLHSRNAIITCLATLTEDDLWRGSHRTIWRTIVDLHTRGTPVDIVTVTDAIDRIGQLDNIGGPAVIADLSAAAYHPSSVGHHAAIVARQAARRRIEQLGQELLRRAADPTDDPTGIAGWASTALERTATTRSTLRVLVGDRIDELADPRWLIDGLLPEGLSMIYGGYGTGKSFFGLSMACAIATGRPWFGRTVTSAPAVYIAAEGAGGIKLRRRAWLLAEHHPDLSHLAVIPQPADPTDAATQAEVARVCEELGAGIVFWDTVARCMLDGDENKTGDMSRFVSGLDQIRDRTAASQVVVHHSGKDGTTRGNTALGAACDGILKVTQSPSRMIRLSCEKAKDALPAPPQDYELHQIGPSAVLRQIRTAALPSPVGSL